MFVGLSYLTLLSLILPLTYYFPWGLAVLEIKKKKSASIHRSLLGLNFSSRNAYNIYIYMRMYMCVYTYMYARICNMDPLKCAVLKRAHGY